MCVPIVVQTHSNVLRGNAKLMLLQWHPKDCGFLVRAMFSLSPTFPHVSIWGGGLWLEGTPMRNLKFAVTKRHSPLLYYIATNATLPRKRLVSHQS